MNLPGFHGSFHPLYPGRTYLCFMILKSGKKCKYLLCTGLCLCVMIPFLLYGKHAGNIQKNDRIRDHFFPCLLIYIHDPEGHACSSQ